MRTVQLLRRKNNTLQTLQHKG